MSYPTLSIRKSHRSRNFTGTHETDNWLPIHSHSFHYCSYLEATDKFQGVYVTVYSSTDNLTLRILTDIWQFSPADNVNKDMYSPYISDSRTHIIRYLAVDILNTAL